MQNIQFIILQYIKQIPTKNYFVNMYTIPMKALIQA